MNFSVAINDSYKTKQGERKEQTTYYNCSYWINAKIVEYLTKGTLVELSGRISSSPMDRKRRRNKVWTELSHFKHQITRWKAKI